MGVNGSHILAGYPTDNTRELSKSSSRKFVYGTLTLYGASFQRTSTPLWRKYGHPKHHIHSPLRESVRFALFPFPSPVLRESLLLSFPAGTKMFQFPAFPLPRQSLGSNSEIPGSTAACASPGLIAACHVLLRISSQAIHWVAWQQIFSLLTPYFLIKREAFDRFLSLQIETYKPSSSMATR